MTNKIAKVADSGVKQLSPEVASRADEIRREQLFCLHTRTDRLFCGLLLFQWVAGIAAAHWVAPRAWAGTTSWVHLHVLTAIFVLGSIVTLPILLAQRYPGRLLTRHVVAAAQLLTSAVLIHLTGGRIETHFHIFGSLAFLAVYRDVRVLWTAMLVAGLDHAVRGAFIPESIYGVASASLWRTVEHGGWLVFEDVFLMLTIKMSVRDMWHNSVKEAILESTNQRVEAEVEQRTLELKAAQDEILHAERMSAIGRLAAGIAHEINTPLQFVGDNIRASVEMVRDFDSYYAACGELIANLNTDPALEPRTAELHALDTQLDVGFLLDDVPLALAQSLKGLERIRTIVVAMKEFSPSGRAREWTPVDVNSGLKSTLIVAHNELKYCSVVNTDFADVLPVLGSPGELNQAFLNLLINAAHAIQAKHREQQGEITVRTAMEGETVVIQISDNGCGMSDEIRRQCFDPFFTTKPPGNGAGQGLAICHAIVVKRHGGQIEVRSTEGAGSTFTVRLPTAGSEPCDPLTIRGGVPVGPPPKRTRECESNAVHGARKTGGLQISETQA